MPHRPTDSTTAFAERTIAARHALAVGDRAGEAEAVRPLRPPTLAEVATAWDAEIAAKPLPDAVIEYTIPEDRGYASLSEVGAVEYVEDLVRPGRIMVVAAEEGTGKSYAIDTELGIRIAVAGGSFAGTWPVLVNGPVLVMSEMHPDDDYDREVTVLGSLGLERSALAGAYYRLPLMTAAGAEAALVADRWLAWIARWITARGVRFMVVDTATGASQVDPWGREIQGVYRRLRALLEDCPDLAVALIVHLKKPQGSGARRLTDVLGEWGRWCDVVMLLEHDGSRTKISTRKRVRHERRVSASKVGGLLVDPIDLDEAKGSKVPADRVLAAIEAGPGITYAALGVELGVSKDTASRYVKALGGRVEVVPMGERGAARVYLTAAPPQTAAGTEYGGAAAVLTTESGTDRRSAAAPYRGAAVSAAVVDPSLALLGSPSPPCFADAASYQSHASEHYRAGQGWACRACEAAA